MSASDVLTSRTRYNGSSPKKTPFQKKLAELRAKKAGKQIQEEDSDDNTPRRALYDTDDDQDEPGDLDGGVQIDSGNQSDSDGSSWIIEDGENIRDAQIPIEFTHLSHQSEQQNFKIFCVWVVQSILNPDFPRDNEISQYAIRALERKMDSYGGSVLQSSIWKAPFMRAMRARPAFETEICDERPNCDACGKGGRPATHAVTFSGNRYDRETLEDFEDSEADDSEDSAGLNIPSENNVFYLGRNCHQRACMSHAFIHWKKELRDEIHGLLQEKGYFSPFWVNKAAKMEITGIIQTPTFHIYVVTRHQLKMANREGRVGKLSHGRPGRRNQSALHRSEERPSRGSKQYGKNDSPFQSTPNLVSDNIEIRRQTRDLADGVDIYFLIYFFPILSLSGFL